MPALDDELMLAALSRGAAHRANSGSRARPQTRDSLGSERGEAHPVSVFASDELATVICGAAMLPRSPDRPLRADRHRYGAGT
jgi:hypothetical protein